MTEVVKHFSKNEVESLTVTTVFRQNKDNINFSCWHTSDLSHFVRHMQPLFMYLFISQGGGEGVNCSAM